MSTRMNRLRSRHCSMRALALIAPCVLAAGIHTTATAQMDQPPPGQQQGQQQGQQPPPAQQEPSGPPMTSPDPAWLERLPPIDRALMNVNIGWALPAFDEHITWYNTDPIKLDAYRGRVVVLQSFSHSNPQSRSQPQQTVNALRRVDEASHVVIGLHTPEGAATAAEALERRRQFDLPVIIDTNGAFCDQLGVFRQPVNLILDKHGRVRYVGLNARGVTAAVTQLIEEPFDPDFHPAQRDPVTRSMPRIEFPEVMGSVNSARDLRGQQGPPMTVQQWLSPAPDPAGRVVIVDFWATWCAPCIEAIPHMNDLASRFRQDALVVGLSDESKGAVERWMIRERRSTDDFNYPIAVDPAGRMKNAFGITGIPHVVVLSADWTVRWQGHPNALTSGVLQRIVDANRSHHEAAINNSRFRWTGGPETQPDTDDAPADAAPGRPGDRMR